MWMVEWLCIGKSERRALVFQFVGSDFASHWTKNANRTGHACYSFHPCQDNFSASVLIRSIIFFFFFKQTLLSAGWKKSHRAHHGNVSPPRVHIALSSYLISAAADNRPTELDVQTWEGFQLNFWVKGYYTDWSAPFVPLPLFFRSSISSLRPLCAFIKISNYFQLQAGCCHAGAPQRQ